MDTSHSVEFDHCFVFDQSRYFRHDEASRYHQASSATTAGALPQNRPALARRGAAATGPEGTARLVTKNSDYNAPQMLLPLLGYDHHPEQNTYLPEPGISDITRLHDDCLMVSADPHPNSIGERLSSGHTNQIRCHGPEDSFADASSFLHYEGADVATNDTPQVKTEESDSWKHLGRAPPMSIETGCIQHQYRHYRLPDHTALNRVVCNYCPLCLNDTQVQDGTPLLKLGYANDMEYGHAPGYNGATWPYAPRSSSTWTIADPFVTSQSGPDRDRHRDQRRRAVTSPLSPGSLPRPVPRQAILQEVQPAPQAAAGRKPRFIPRRKWSPTRLTYLAHKQRPKNLPVSVPWTTKGGIDLEDTRDVPTNELVEEWTYVTIIPEHGNSKIEVDIASRTTRLNGLTGEAETVVPFRVAVKDDDGNLIFDMSWTWGGDADRAVVECEERV